VAIVPHPAVPPLGAGSRSTARCNDAVIRSRSSRLGGNRRSHHLLDMSMPDSKSMARAAALPATGATPAAPPAANPDPASGPGSAGGASEPMPREIGGPKGPEPTRYGDWERNGRCSDF
jgi:hypothetical protein